MTLRSAYSRDRFTRPFPSKASVDSSPPPLLRLLPAGAKVAGRDLHPLNDCAFARRTLTSGLRVQPFQLAAGLGGNRKKTPHLSERAVLSDARVCDQVRVFRGPTAAPPLRMNDATSCRPSFQAQPIRLATAGRSPILRAQGTRKVIQHRPEVANLTSALPQLPARRDSVHRSAHGPVGPRSGAPSCSPAPLRPHWSDACVVRDPARYSVRTRTYLS